MGIETNGRNKYNIDKYQCIYTYIQYIHIYIYIYCIIISILSIPVDQADLDTLGAFLCPSNLTACLAAKLPRLMSRNVCRNFARRCEGTFWENILGWFFVERPRDVYSKKWWIPWIPCLFFLFQHLC